MARRSGVALVRATLSRLGLAAVRAVARVSSFDLGISVVNKILRFYPVSPHCGAMSHQTDISNF